MDWYGRSGRGACWATISHGPRDYWCNGDITTGIGSERVSGADMCPALFENGLFPETPNPYFFGSSTRSPSAVVAIPGSITIWWIVFPDWATINCKCRSGRPGTTMVCVPVQSGFTE